LKGFSRLFPTGVNERLGAEGGARPAPFEPPAPKGMFLDRLVTYLPRILPYLKPYWGLGLVTTVMYAVTIVVGLLEPWPLKILIDSALGSHPPPAVVTRATGGLLSSPFAVLGFAVIAQLGLTVLASAAGVVNAYAHTKLEQGMALDFRGDLFDRALRMSLSYHDERRSGMLIYIINSLGSAAPSLAMTVLPLLQSVLTLIGMFWIALNLDRDLALVSLVIVPFLYYSVRYYTRNIQQPIYRVRMMEGETLSIIHEAISMLRVIVAFGRERSEFARFREQGDQAVSARVKLTVRQTLFSLAVNTTTAVGGAIVLGLGAYHVMLGRLTVGELLIVLSYVASVYAPLQSISGTIGSLQDQFVNLALAFDLLDKQPDIQDEPGAQPISRAAGRLTFDHVHFNYKGRVDTLKDLTFDVDEGQVIAIVGPTGAGKTTLASLLPRFYDATAGRILLDGIDIRHLTVESLRHQISIVLQEPLLFSKTIADNIRYGKLEASMDEIIEAARAANAHDFIMALPQQYASMVGERGAQLSGGERQRIAVARAFLKNAPILILDEPTSSIDSKTERVILEALDRLMVGRTTFMIAHRLATVRHADQILVLNHGCLVQRGTHVELMHQDGLYKQLYEMQTGEVRRRVIAALESKAAVVKI
jgi:ATP-binding cassette subfamily B protein